MSLNVKVRTRSDIDRVLRAKKRGELDSITRASAYTRAVMRNTLGRRKNPRPAGEPVTSPTGRGRRATLFSVDRTRGRGIIGPDYRRIGKSMRAHDLGLRFRGDKIPARPFRTKTLERAAPKLSRYWRGSIS